MSAVCWPSQGVVAEVQVLQDGQLTQVCCGAQLQLVVLQVQLGQGAEGRQLCRQRSQAVAGSMQLTQPAKKQTPAPTGRHYSNGTVALCIQSSWQRPGAAVKCACLPWKQPEWAALAQELLP